MLSIMYVYGVLRINKKVLAKIKDKVHSEAYMKLYGYVQRCVIDVERDEQRDKKNKLAVKKSKEIKKCVVKRAITFDD